MLIVIVTNGKELVEAKSIATMDAHEYNTYLSKGYDCRVISDDSFDEAEAEATSPKTVSFKSPRHFGKTATLKKMTGRDRDHLNGQGLNIEHPSKGWLEKYAKRSGINIISNLSQ